MRRNAYVGSMTQRTDSGPKSVQINLDIEAKNFIRLGFLLLLAAECSAARQFR